MRDARNTQIKIYYGNGIIHQDAQLIDFVHQNKIQQITIKDKQDRKYFSQQMPEVIMSDQFFKNSFLYVVIKKNPQPRLCWESFLTQLVSEVNHYCPAWLYVAINQYIVTTEIEWPNLTNNYPQDLLNSLSARLCDYKELTRNDPVDLGQNFNFAHPTTYAYYQRTNN